MNRARIARALRLLRHPVAPEKKRLLAERWTALDPELRFPLQGFGQQATGCGATIGLMPRCDFDCRGCYLGDEANQVRRFDLDETFRQLDELRRWLGPKGNVQITDGEVTLLPEGELVAVLRRCAELELIPMVMTHGDSFRRKPGLLPRLVAEGGLREVSIHVDATQRGRRGWREEASEERLMAVREEFADVVRRTRRETGVRLRAATTMTVTRDNLEDVPGVVDWTLRNRDAFGLISFQPLARVGRTETDLQGVDVEALWERIGRALRPYGFVATARSPLQLGHRDCTRMEPLAVYERPGSAPRVVQIVRPGCLDDEEMVRGFFARAGGVNFRDDSLLERLCRGAGVFTTDLPWFLGPARAWAEERAAELGTTLTRLALDTVRGRARLDGFSVVSHHFMSEQEVWTARGQERLDACVFRLAVGGELVPMCRVNATRLRERVYARGTAAPSPEFSVAAAAEPAAGVAMPV